MMNLSPLDINLETSIVGGKAFGLSRLIEFGVSVPLGFVIPKTVLIYFNANGMLPDGFTEELNKAISTLDSENIIIRSSAIGEDSKSHSFAGQLDSFVVKNELESAQKAIQSCWEGLGNDRVLAYQKISGIKLTEMGVVIQEFVEAEYAGVTFTQSPYNEKELYTEYVKGAGEQLVSGKVTPKSFTVANDKLLNPLPFNGDMLIQQSKKLKEFYGCHLDIEWVAKENEIYFVQARPITVETKQKVHWSNTNLNENYPDPISPLLYSIARDSYYHYFKNISGLLQINPETIRSLEYDFSNSVGIWANRIYYNMTSIHNILSSSPLKDYFKDAFNQFVGYKERDVATSNENKKTSVLKLVYRLIALNLKLESHVLEIEGKVDSFSRRVDEEANSNERAVLFYEFLDLRFNQWYHASLADLFSMIHYKLLGRFTKKFYGEESTGVHNVLIQAIPGLISSAPLNDTWDIVSLINKSGAEELFSSNNPEFVYAQIQQQAKWKAVKTAIQAYLKKWGFRCSGELMFTKKNYIEEPEKFIELLQSYMKNTAQDPRVVIKAKDEERRKAFRTFAVKIIRKRHILLPWSLYNIGQLYIISKLCKQAISSRERVRYKQAEMYYKFKVVMKEIGRDAVIKGILNNYEDVFLLKYKEVGELISSSNMFSVNDLAKNRKEAFEVDSKKEFPQHFSTFFGERPEFVKDEVALIEGAKEFSGLAASGGRIKGQVKVLESVLEGGKINKGDILVTKQTDPGWAMVFPLIGGLIVERGGALSHGAIVAREFGIPAVLGIDNITKILKDNDEVILDGDLGKIQILS
jgi:phosphohistidine swiveling domain-containing protein